jgi:endonuclease G
MEKPMTQTTSPVSSALSGRDDLQKIMDAARADAERFGRSDDRLQQIRLAAGIRWRQREAQRQEKVAKVHAGKINEVEPQERINLRLRHLTDAVAKLVAPPQLLARRASLVETVGLERVIGKRDFVGIEFLEMALAVARFVGRVSIRSSSGAIQGFGTGFMVSPRLLMTNNHVLDGALAARFSEVEFDFQNDRAGRPLPVKSFRLLPEEFFLTDPELDFTLVAVAPRSANDPSIELSRYTWTRLNGQQGKALLGDALNIIQHPRGEPKQLVLRSNELVDLLDTFAHYVTDTDPGSSGSPVFNDQWEVVALHHSGVPRVDGAGNILTRDGAVWQSGMDPSLIDWAANEGVRVSSLVEHIAKQNIRPEWQALRRDLLEKDAPHPMEKVIEAQESPGTTVAPVGFDRAVDAASSATTPRLTGYTWTIPLHVTVQLGAVGGAVVATAGAASQAPVAEPPVTSDGSRSAVGIDLAFDEERVSIDPDYSNRNGYDASFLGNGQRRVPLPKLTSAMLKDAAINTKAAPGDAEPHVLRYHHYSVVHNKSRRTAYFTAVNIDGRQSARQGREEDAWFFDPRIPREFQAGNDVYKSNPLDRGHLVRRLDPAWGSDDDTIKAANDDTFHYTNCAPQHEGFNRNKTTWGGIEDYILNNADNRDLKVCVITGPVLRGTDPPYRTIQLPLEFWKVVVMARQNGALSATAYLLSQAALIDELPQEEFVFGKYRSFQVPIRKIEQLTGLDFGTLKKSDPLEKKAARGIEASQIREIGAPSEAILS